MKQCGLAVLALSLVHLTTAWTNDVECFNSAFNTSTKSKTLLDEVQVNIKHLHYYQHNFGDVQITTKSDKTEILKRGERTVFTYRNPTSMFWTDYNPRNLTLLFDGEQVHAAIGHLDNENVMGDYTEQWLSCESGSAAPEGNIYMEFYHSHDLFLSGSTSSFWEKLEIEVAPSNTPFGPSYDSECAAMMGAKSTALSERKGSMKVHIKHISRTSISTGTFDSVLSERDVTVTAGENIVVQYNHTKADDDYGFTGWKVSPRNLTLWLDGDGQLQAAIATLAQSHMFINGQQVNKEEWECPEVAEEDEGLEIVFCSFSTYSSVSGSFSSSKDVIQLSSDAKRINPKLSAVAPLMVAFKKFV